MEYEHACKKKPLQTLSKFSQASKSCGVVTDTETFVLLNLKPQKV